jgi:hypothetical protein
MFAGETLTLYQVGDLDCATYTLNGFTHRRHVHRRRSLIYPGIGDHPHKTEQALPRKPHAGGFAQLAIPPPSSRFVQSSSGVPA